MGRSLLIVAALAAVVLLLRPRGQRQTGSLRGWPWLAVGLMLQVLWVRGISLHQASPGVLHWLPSLAVLFALRFLWLNRQYRGLWLLAVGAGLNLLVMVENGGLMPLAPPVLHALGGSHHATGAVLGLSKARLLGDGVAHLALLGDRLVWHVAGLRIAASLGDLLVLIGCLVTVGEEIWRGARSSTRPDSAARTIPTHGWRWLDSVRHQVTAQSHGHNADPSVRGHASRRC